MRHLRIHSGSFDRAHLADTPVGLPPTMLVRAGVLALALLPLSVAAGSVSGSLGSGVLAASRSAASEGTTAAGGSSPSARVSHHVPSVLSGLSLATYVAPAPTSRVLTIGISAQRPDPAAVSRRYDAVYDPSSPLYRHFLTPSQFDAEFGLPSSQVSAIGHWLTSTGLSIRSVSGDGSYYLASGTVGQLQRLFDVRIGSYRFDGRTFLANDVAPSVPSGLPVDDVLGLDTVQKFSLAPLSGAVSNVPSGTEQGPQAGTQETLTPQDLWGVYNDPGAGDQTITDQKTGVSNTSALEGTGEDFGQGQTIGVFGEGETSSVIDQLRLFERSTGLPRVPVRTVYTEGTPGSAYGDNLGSIEWNLDTQASTGMAPDVSQLDLYFAKSLIDADVFQEFSYWVNDPQGPQAMNASFGECEANPTGAVTNPLAEVPYGTGLGNQVELAGDPMLEQATLEGRTLFTASGDTGSGCDELVVPVAGPGNGAVVQPVPEVTYPCSSVYAVCVGGTVVSVNGASYPQSSQRTAETSWTFGGGGTSFYTVHATFQAKVANIDMPCVSTPQGVPYPPGSEPVCRGVPDVSDMSGSVTGGNEYFFYNDGAPSKEGGTSLSSPLMVGQWARVQAAASKATQSSGGLGFADPIIYGQASSADACSSSATATAAQTGACTSAPYAQDFTDITESEYGVGNGLYQPGPGWDYASGWGALNVANFIADVDCSAQSDGCASTPPGTGYSLGNWDHKAGNYSGTLASSDSYGGQEVAPVVVTTATLYGPQGWSTDPFDQSALVPGPGQGPGGPNPPLPGDNTTTNYDPSLDITGGTLTANADTVTATITGPYLGSLPPPTAAGGSAIYYVAWEYSGVVYYAAAIESAGSGSWSYTSGSTAGGMYANTTNSAATGSLSTTGEGSTITIAVPASEVGSPPAGALLDSPQVFDQLDSGTPAAGLLNGVDSADDLVPVSQLQSGDCSAPQGRTLGDVNDQNPYAGQQVQLCSLAESQGVAVQVQAAPPPPTGSGGTAPLVSITVGPVTITVQNPGIPLLPLVQPGLAVIGPAAGNLPTESKTSLSRQP